MEHIWADIGVIAAGPSGMAAAITAAENGLSVVVFEKSNVPGGTANMGMGPFGVESKLQKESGVGLTREEAFKIQMDYTHWAVDARIVHDYFWKSADTINWLMDMGVEFAGVGKYYPAAEPTWHIVQPEGGARPGPRSAGAMNKKLYERAKELGVVFYMECPVDEIIRKDGIVCGFRARDKEGKEYEINSKAVIVCTGGYGDNPDMIKEYTGYTYGKDMLNFRVPGITGDGCRMVWAIGGAKGHTEMERLVNSFVPPFEKSTVAFKQPTALVVNLLGERIMNEEFVDNMSVFCNVVTRQKDKVVYCITSSNIIKYYKKYGVDYPDMLAHDDPVANFEDDAVRLSQEFPEDFFVADSLEELGEKIGLKKEEYLNTIEQYNDSCEDHVDDLFCKNYRYLKPLKGKRFYALRFFPGAYGSLGGIKINYKYEVLDEDWEPIPGLYAAGSDVCDIYAGTYLYRLPGNTMGFALNSGRIAGDNVVEKVKGMEDSE